MWLELPVVHNPRRGSAESGQVALPEGKCCQEGVKCWAGFYDVKMVDLTEIMVMMRIMAATLLRDNRLRWVPRWGATGSTAWLCASSRN